jgi:TonB family protein
LVKPAFVSAQQDGASRKVVNRVVPQYPILAHTLKLSGTVKVEAHVSKNGSVTLVELKGGHPVLAQAAVNAVRMWKWEPATHESTEPVEVRFDAR